MATHVSEVVDAASGVVLATVTADTDYAGAQIRFFDQWHGPVPLERMSAALAEAALFLRDNGVTQ